MSDALSKAEFFQYAQTRWERVRVGLPGGESIWVRSLASGEAEQVGAARENQSARLVALCACDEAGKRLFAEDDQHEIARMPFPVVNAIAEAAMRLNSLGADAYKEAGKKLKEDGGERAFRHVLALALGRTLHELGQSVSAAEMVQWKAFFCLYPFGEGGAWLRAGVAAAAAASAFGGKATPEMFMPPLPGTAGPKKEAQLDLAQSAALLRTLAGEKK